MMPTKWFLRLAIVFTLIGLAACRASLPEASATTMPVLTRGATIPGQAKPAYPGTGESNTPLVTETATVDMGQQYKTPETKPGQLYPAESQSPAAGICARQPGDSVQLAVSLEMPAPRCVQVEPQQKLKISNQTGAPLTIHFAWYELALQPQEALNLDAPANSYLSPGVHHLEVTAGNGMGPEIWVLESAQSGELAQPVEVGTIQGAPRFSPDGASLVAPTSLGVAFYDVQTLNPLGIFEVETGAQYLAFSPDGTRLASGGGWHVQLWQREGVSDPEDWKLLRALTGSTSSLDSELVNLGFSPDGQLIAAGFRSPSTPPDGAILMWTAQDGEFHTSMLGMTFDFSPAQPRLISVWQGSDEATIYSYSFSGAPTDIFHGEQAFFSPAGLLATERDGYWRLIDMLSGDTVFSLNGQALAFSPDGERLAILERGEVHLYQLPAGVMLGILDGSWDQALKLQFSPDGQNLAGVVNGCPSSDEVCEQPSPHIAVWHLSDGKLTLNLSGNDYSAWFAFTPDGKQLAVSSPGGEMNLHEITQLGE